MRLETGEKMARMSVGAVRHGDVGRGTNESMITKAEMSGMTGRLSVLKYSLLMSKYCLDEQEVANARIYWRIAVGILAKSEKWRNVGLDEIAKGTLAEFHAGRRFSNAERAKAMGVERRSVEKMKRYGRALTEILLLEVEGLTIVSDNLGR